MGSKTRRSSVPRAGSPPWLAAATGPLATHLARQRWFASKTRTVAGLTLLDQAAVPGTPGILALFRAEFAVGDPEVYCVPLLPPTPDPAERAFVDGLDDPSFSLALVEAIRRNAILEGMLGTFRCSATAALPAVLTGPPGEATRIRAEQSHTSVVFDRRAILKLYRSVAAGPTPELEITEFLTHATSFRGTPRLLGSIAYEAAAGEATTVAVLHEFVENGGDAWTLIAARLDEYYGAAGLGPAPVVPADSAFARTLAAADAREARILGTLTGQLHCALASGPSDSPMAPEPIGPDDLVVWRDAMQIQLDEAMATLASGLGSLTKDGQALARRVIEAVPVLRQELGALEALGADPVAKIRVHGDYHLGQVLRTAEGFAIIDFEGEPARSLADRRAKQCALRDVAGMLRSFNYAARVAIHRVAEGAPEVSGLTEHLAPWADAWEESARAGFLTGYLEETWARHAVFLPRDREALDSALRAFELEKAIYELRYELTHRPGWARIPLEGLVRLAVAGPKPGPVELRSDAGRFDFVACLELREFVGVRAEDERQLAELIEQVPPDSIYYHTHAFFLRHKFLAGIYPNDFATWVAVHVRDQILGERLAMIDPAEFADLQALREEFVAVIDDHLRQLQIVPRVVSAEPFDFVRSRIVEVPTGVQVGTLAEFRQALLEVDVSAIYFHLVEARLRLGRGQNDFAAWLELGLGLPGLAARVRAVNPYAGSLERTRGRLLQLCDEALAEGAAR